MRFSYLILIMSILITNDLYCSDNTQLSESVPTPQHKRSIDEVIKLLEKHQKSNKPMYLWNLSFTVGRKRSSPAKIRDILIDHPEVIQKYNIQDAAKPCWAEWTNSFLNKAFASCFGRILGSTDSFIPKQSSSLELTALKKTVDNDDEWEKVDEKEE